MPADKQIAVAVVLQSGCVLAGIRSDTAAECPGAYEFPGGKVEPHENPNQAAARECLEETGIEIDVGPIIDRSFFENETGFTEILFFSGSVRQHSFALTQKNWVCNRSYPLSSLPPFFWLPIDALRWELFPAANRRVLDVLLAFQGGSLPPRFQG